MTEEFSFVGQTASSGRREAREGAKENSLFVRVVPELTLQKQFDYEVPRHLRGKLKVGHRVRVPWGKEVVLAYAVDFVEEPQVFPCKPVLEIVEEEPLIASTLLELARWLADYYCCDFSLALRGVLPGVVRSALTGHKEALWVSIVKEVSHEDARQMLAKRAPLQLRAWMELQASGEGGWLAELIEKTGVQHAAWRGLEKRGWIELGKRYVERSPFSKQTEATKPYRLTQEQAEALGKIVDGFAAESTAPFLLQGVTGSGKTEIYLQALERVLEEGRNALVLVPEIALTPQTVRHFRERFEAQGVRVAVMHSQLSLGERYDQWQSIRRGEARVVIGARSAIFAPVQKLGLIIVDEEHETSYKQEEAPHYHARDVAVMRARLEKAVVLLGSATPSLESFWNAKQGRYKLLRLQERVDGGELPLIHVIDMRKEKSEDKKSLIVSKALRLALQKRLEAKQQSILFLNRRGFSTMVQCPSCGYTEQCPHCSISLIYHRTNKTLRCHLCNYQKNIPQVCPECSFDKYQYSGVGTQKIEDIVQTILPSARWRRVDSDTMRNRQAYERVFEEFGSGKLDVLIGTQMIAKGLHFPNVTCVGVIHIDQTLQLPDFRAAEKVFQQLVQVAGRSGRGEHAGEVFFQSYTPFHPAIQFARHHDVDGFLEQELEYRRAHSFPPFARVALVIFRSKSEEMAAFCIEQLAKRMRELNLEHTEVSDPTPAPIAKVEDFYRFHLFLKTSNILALSRLLKKQVLETEWPQELKTSVVIDPYQLL